MSSSAAQLMAASCLARAVCRRVGWPFLGGMFLAFACGHEVAPRLLVPHLFVRWDWPGLGGVVVGGLAILALPALWGRPRRRRRPAPRMGAGDFAGRFAVLILPCLMPAGVVWHRAAGWKLALVALFLLTLGSRLPSLAPLGTEWSWWVWIVQSKYWWSALVAAAVCYRLRGSFGSIVPVAV